MIAGHEKPPLLEAMLGRVKRLVADQRLRFIAIGATNTVLTTLFYAGLVIAFGEQTPAVVSFIISWVVSLVSVYVVYRRFVFNDVGPFLPGLLKFASVNVTSLALNAVALVAATEYFGFDPIVSQICISICIVVFNYFAHKHFSFRSRRA